MNKTVAFDVGFGHTKGKNERMEVSIPSVIGQSRELIENDVTKRKPVDNIVDVKRGVFVGDLALRQSATKSFSLNDSKVDHESTVTLIETMLGILSQGNNVNVVTGLPVTYFLKQKNEMERLINKSHGIDVNLGGHRITKSVTVDDVKIVPQPMGSALDFILDNNGDIRETIRDIAKGRIGVLDIGFYTNDLLVLDGLEINADMSRSLRSGISVAYKALNDAGIDLPLYELDKKLRGGYYESAARKAYEGLAKQIVGEVETYWRDVDLIIVTGGGGTALYEYMKLPHTSKLADDASLGNVRGYYKLGRRSWR